MKTARIKILEMLNDGLITADEAYHLLDNLKDHQPMKKNPSIVERIFKESPPIEKCLRIKITTNSTGKIIINLPINVIKAAINLGNAASMLNNSFKVASSNKLIKDNLDINLIIECIQNGYEGDILDITTEDDESIKISIS